MTDDTSLTNPVTDGNGEPTATDNKEPALVPSSRLREEAEKRRELEAKIAEYDAKLAEKDNLLSESEAKIQQERMNIEKQFAEKMYGADMVNDTAVQEYKTKYPDLEYPQIFWALWIEVPPTSQWYTWMPWRTSIGQNMKPTTISKDDLQQLYVSDYKQYKSIMEKVVSREIQIV